MTADIFDKALQREPRQRDRVEEFKKPSNTITKPMSTETFESNLAAVEQFGFLNKYSNKEELMVEMRSIFTNAIDPNESSVSAKKMEMVIKDIESKLILSGVTEKNVRQVKEMLMDNVSP